MLFYFVAGTAMADVNDRSWMSGCRAANGRGTGSIEYWTAPAGGTMSGVSRTVANDKTVAFEYLRIAADEKGNIALISSPPEQETLRFELLSLSPRDVVFENTEHDFPQRIIYSLDSDNNLQGRIEGSINGQARTVDFPITRIDCDENRAAP